MTASIQETMKVIRQFAKDFAPKIGIILGSGLGAIADELTDSVTIPFDAIPGIQAGKVEGHASLLVLGYLNGVPIACLKGRLHVYEGASYAAVKTLVQIIKFLGANTIVITGAAGSLNPDINAGEIMLINDHINFHPNNALVGPNDETIGPRFLSLENAYDKDLREIMHNIGRRLNINLSEGVYISVLGPSFETPAEIRAYRLLGADVVGMSVVPEVIVARHCGLKVLGLAAITNLAVGLSAEKITHEVTLRHAHLTARKLLKLIPEFVSDPNL